MSRGKALLKCAVLGLMVVVVALAQKSTSKAASGAADLVLINGKVLTVDAKDSIAVLRIGPG